MMQLDKTSPILPIISYDIIQLESNKINNFSTFRLTNVFECTCTHKANKESVADNIPHHFERFSIQTLERKRRVSFYGYIRAQLEAW